MNRKIYEPVREFERQTSYCLLYLAFHVFDEVRHYFHTPIPEVFADTLARRAEAVFAHHPSWQRKYQSRRGRGYILSSMRHWLAGVLARERPALFRQLPESFKIGHPLPRETAISPQPSPDCATLSRSRDRETGSRSGGRSIAKGQNHRPRFVHGCKLLAL